MSSEISRQRVRDTMSNIPSLSHVSNSVSDQKPADVSLRYALVSVIIVDARVFEVCCEPAKTKVDRRTITRMHKIFFMLSCFQK